MANDCADVLAVPAFGNYEVDDLVDGGDDGDTVVHLVRSFDWSGVSGDHLHDHASDNGFACAATTLLGTASKCGMCIHGDGMLE